MYWGSVCNVKKESDIGVSLYLKGGEINLSYTHIQ